MKKQDKPAEFTTTQNADGSVTGSMKLSEMNQEQIEQLLSIAQQRRDKARADCIHLRALLDKKLEERRVAGIDAEIERLKAAREGGAAVHGTAPGTVIEVQASRSVDN